MSVRLQDCLVVVTGVGYKPAKRIFSTANSCDLIEIDGIKNKLNVGAAVCEAVLAAGGRICMVARTERKLVVLRDYLQARTNCAPAAVTATAADVLDEPSVQRLAYSLQDKGPVWLVHSVGLGAESYSVNGDNPYRRIDEIPANLPTVEFDVVVRGLLLMVRNLLPLFMKQPETRIVVITSMSGIRPYKYGYAHSSAKAGIHHAVRSLTLELSAISDSIYTTEILPGIVDTGLYDSDEVIQSVGDIGESFGYFGPRRYRADTFPLMPPRAVADAVLTALKSEAHILSINMVAKGQFPNIGA